MCPVGDCAVVFDGSALELAGAVSPDQASTYVFRLKPNPGQSGAIEILGAQTDEPTFPTWHRNVFQSGSGSVCTDDRTDAGSDNVCAAAALSPASVNDVAIRLADSEATVLLRGFDPVTAGDWLLPGVQRWVVGATTGGTNAWKGEISDLLIFGRGLDDTEIEDLFADLDALR